jgi:zinc and cadmium transporter
MQIEAIYTLLSVIVVSLVSLIGILFISRKKEFSHSTLLFLVSMSVGTLIGGAFLHLLPETVEHTGFGISVSLLVLAGFLIFYLLESVIHMHHEHMPKKNKHHHHHHAYHLAPMNLIGDGLHNFIDGLVIAGAYLVSIPVGIATTIAVIFHEVPQEIADFGVLLYSGLKKKKAILFNFLSAAVAIIGAVVGLILGNVTEHFVEIVLPFAAGGFIYIASANLIPELQSEKGFKNACMNLLAIVLGIAIMIALLFLGH